MRLEREKSWYLGSTAVKDNGEHWSQHLATECKKLRSGEMRKSLNILIIKYDLLLLQLQCDRYMMSSDPPAFPFLACD